MDCDQVPYYKNSLKTLLLGSEAERRDYQEEGVPLPQVVPPQLSALYLQLEVECIQNT